MEPLNLTELAKAVDWWKTPWMVKDGEMVGDADPYPLAPLIAAVDAVLQADQYQWCKTHGDHKTPGVPVVGRCRWAYYVLNNEPEKQCELQAVVVIPVETP